MRRSDKGLMRLNNGLSELIWKVENRRELKYKIKILIPLKII